MRTESDQATRINPFPGLRPFREDEEYLFFGRESQVDAMVNKLAAKRFLAVVGTSGSGKSSLVNCGLRPALHVGLMGGAGTTWRMAQFRPGSDPLGALARALAADGVLFRDFEAGGLPLEEIIDTTLRMSKLGLVDIYQQARLEDDTNLLVVVDQFEELFRFRQVAGGREEDIARLGEEAIAFVNLLLEAMNQTACPVYVVLTMRSDFLGDCAQFPGLAEAVNAGQFLVPRMTRDERRDAITGPAAVGGSEISPVLLTRLVNDVGDNPDQLSILQHALNRTWARAQKDENGGHEGALELSHYEAIGTMEHALDQHAEKAHAELTTPRQQQICEKLFKALTDKASDPRGIRRPTTLSTLCALADGNEAELIEVIEVIDVFRSPSRSFLMPPVGETLRPETVVDISHETLLRVWRRLDNWADEEAEAVVEYLRLADSAKRWKAGHAELLQKRELERAQEWLENGKPTAAWAERYHPGFVMTLEYLGESRKAEGEKNRRVRNARRILQVSVAATCLVLAGITVWALGAQREAEEATRVAQYNEGLGWMLRAEVAEERGKRFPDTLLHAARAIGFEGSGRPPGDLSEFPRLIRESSDPTKYQEARDWIRTRPHFLPVWSGAVQGSPITGLTMSPEGRWLAISAEDGSVSLWDLAAGESEAIEVVPASGKPTRAVVFHPIGKLLAVAEAAQVRLWNLEKQAFEAKAVHGAPVTAIAYSPGGQILAGADDGGKINLWKDNGLRVIESKQAVPASTLSFSSNDSALVAVYPDRSVSLFFHQVGEPHRAWAEHSGEVTSAAFSPDGEKLALGSMDGGVSVWDVASARLLGEAALQQSHEGAVLDLDFSLNGKQLASASTDETIKLWKIENKKPEVLATLTGHRAEVTHVEFAPGGMLLASASADGSAKLWDISGRALDSPPLYDYLARNWYEFDQKTLKPVWKSGEGYLNLPPDSVVGIWQRKESEMLFSRFVKTRNWTGAILTAGPADLKVLGEMLLTDAREAVKDYRWDRVRLRLRQLEVIGAGSGGEVIQIKNQMEKISTEGTDFTNGEGMDLIWSPAGIFKMGSPPDEPNRKLIEAQSEENIGHGFWIGKREISQEEYRVIMGVNPSTHKSSGPSAPAENMSWNEAMEFCRKLTDRERARGAVPSGWEYTLPTEAQWEYACRAGTNTAYSFGDDPSDLFRFGNFSDLSGGRPKDDFGRSQDDGYKNTAPLGSYRSNPWGLYDMHGNVFEWCRDALYSEGAVLRPLRGGSFHDTAADCRSAFRYAYQPAHRDDDVGFRPVLTVVGSSAASAQAQREQQQWEALVPSDSEWRWHHPLDDLDPARTNTDVHASFFNPDYDDSSWPTGKDGESDTDGFGYGDPGFEGVDIGTPKEEGQGKIAFFRHRFTTDKQFTSLELRCQRDDGIIIYLDGKEVGRDNIGENSQPGSRRAFSPIGGGEERSTLRIPLRLQTLPAGEHVLAISLHNTEQPSSDLRIAGITLVGVEIQSKEEVETSEDERIGK